MTKDRKQLIEEIDKLQTFINLCENAKRFGLGLDEVTHDKYTDAIARQRELGEQLEECQKKLDLLEGIRRELRDIENFSVDSIGDIAHIMKQKNKLAKMRWTMILTGIPVSALQLAALILGITHGLWWLLAVWACVAIPWGICISKYYFNHVAYICPECHEVFKPKMKEAFWAYHTPKMRRLTCPKCGRKGLCVEVYAEKEDKK